MRFPYSFLPSGDQTLTVEFGTAIDPQINDRVIALAADLADYPIAGVTEITPTYRSLLLRYDPHNIRGAALERALATRIAGLGDVAAAGREWRVPICYGGAVGQDLQDLADMKGMPVQQVIDLHLSAQYRVYMIGFAPGFAYLGGLPQPLHTPRLAKPRQLIPEGAVGIGGQQANINSVAGPSGWRFIGWTPVKLFDPKRAQPFLLAAGDRLRFAQITADEGAQLAARAANGDPLIAPTVMS
ncbi:allophanate hydrolase [Thioclava sp. SK-1]|uniref:5-oxoprolinase subunit PxpB n=1 Tax=Thioclava sp. SK-1 TaxID=1889770 RepID=UPI000826A300|nr:5-oxoprolinase subunit PxpB [Thioclava sp. SK-1]OCX66254.1 allophanate hydrolase [Thioclava sp. SK-1]